MVEVVEETPLGPPPRLHAEFYPHRGLTAKTNEFYGIQTKFLNGEPFEDRFPYLRGSKIRSLNKEIPKSQSFRAIGDMKDPDLFGMDKFDPGSKPSITITAGEYDGPSVYQVTQGATAAVSLPSGALGAALKCVIKNRNYIEAFQKIYLCLDNDANDQETTREIAQLFDYSKVYIVKLTKHKDANDYLQAGDDVDLLHAWNAAKRYSPDNVISTFSDIENALNEAGDDQIGTYPWKQMNDMTYGLHAGEVIVLKGLEKIGKTELFRAMEHHLLKTTDHNMVVIHLEENVSTTIKGVAGYELEVPAMLPDSGLTKDDIFSGYRKAVGDNDNRIHIYTSYDTGSEKEFFSNLRFLVKAYNCKFVFLDHISWLATGLQDDDERKTLDRISQNLKSLAKELKFCLVMISHVNDLGQTRGSRNITKACDTIIHLERDKMALAENVRNTTYLMLEGVRLGGQSGPAGAVVMDRMSGKLKEAKIEIEERLPLVA